MSVRSQRLLSRFACLQDRCEDTCCAGLTIPVERAAASRLVSLGLGAGLVEGPDGARLLKDARGACAFLAGGKCQVHAAHGAGALPEACATFPRVIQRRGAETFVTASLACPEIARLALLAPDGLEPEPFERAALPRPEQPGVEVPAVPERLRALLAAELPLASRLVAMAHWAARPDEPCGPAQLAAIHHNFEQFELETHSVPPLFAELLTRRRSARGASARFVEWAQAPRAELSGAELEPWLSRRARYQLERHPPDREQAPRFVAGLALRLALLTRSIEASPPPVDAPAPEVSAAPLSERFVRAAQLLAKHVETSEELAELEEALFSGGPERAFLGTLLFAKVLAA